MIFAEPPPPRPPLRTAIYRDLHADETARVRALLDELDLDTASFGRIDERARRLAAAVRAQRLGRGGLDAFLHEYGLSSREGVLLMCVAEALLRVPDDETRQRLIRDKLSSADWERHLGRSSSLFVNASTWALMLTGRMMRMGDDPGRTAVAALRRLVGRLGEPVVREAVDQAMRIMGRQYVMGRTIEEALGQARAMEGRGYRYSYDMLGESARTTAAAERYLEAYRGAIAAVGEAALGHGRTEGGVRERPGISVKLSALHPRFEPAQAHRVRDELVPRVTALAREAAAAGIGMTIDAEEVERLQPSLDVIEAIAADPSLAGWDGFGVVVQGYTRAAPALLDWLADLARRHRRRLMVRLVKGAYWDAEIKRAQELGLDAYPVFTRKSSTDCSYLACARRLLAEPELFYPQFATHNAHTAAAVLELAGGSREFEFQRLHGMGEALHEALAGRGESGVGCRIYAPVGRHEDLLAYLVRRLLENGANSSFVNRLQDDRLPVADIVADPVGATRGLAHLPHPRIPPPREMYLPERLNARGIDLTDPSALADLARRMREADARPWTAAPIVAGEEPAGAGREVRSPADLSRVVGRVLDAGEADVEAALAAAADASGGWAALPVEERAGCLDRAAALLEEEMPALMSLAVREAGKTIADAVSEVREAVDFCRYYAARAREDLAPPARLEGGGVFACISPWNFPLAIFTGQVTAALVAGNAVVAKPAEQTPLMAAAAVRLLHRAGVPPEVLHLLPGDGARVGGRLVADERIAGVVFTGSGDVARQIDRKLRGRGGAPRVLVAETGGLNAMIVDSTALPEQVVRDAVAGAFRSAGQRCSALRVLFLQDDVADRVLEMLAGAIEELVVGDPAQLSTDVGPVIDAEAQAVLERHIGRMRREARQIVRAPVGPGTGAGTFVAPVAFEIDRISRLDREVFGPVLHVVRYAADRLSSVVEAIDATGYGLTLGIQSRIDETWRLVFDRARVGNTYVNRNQIGAVVGVQPFGGQGRSGTGPKAGGPFYLHRFVAERPAAAPEGVCLAAAPKAVSTRDACRDDEASAAPAGFLRASVEGALAAGASAGPAWDLAGVDERAAVLERVAELLVAEGTGPDEARPDSDPEIEEVGHAAERLRRCAAQARSVLAAPQPLPGPTGERNERWFRARGTILCVCAGRQPLLGCIGQIAAALAAGNAVVAWHGDGERLRRVAALFRDAGLPEGVLGLLSPGEETSFGDLLGNPRIAAVCVAGSAALVGAVDRALAGRDGSIAPLIVHADGRAGLPIGMPAITGAHYLERFVHERTLSVDTTAAGGNASLLTVGGEG